MMDLPYYPKLQGCVPFSPVPGPRLLTVKTDQVEGARSKAAIQRALGMALIQLMGASSLLPVQVMSLIVSMPASMHHVAMHAQCARLGQVGEAGPSALYAHSARGRAKCDSGG